MRRWWSAALWIPFLVALNGPAWAEADPWWRGELNLGGESYQLILSLGESPTVRSPDHPDLELRVVDRVRTGDRLRFTLEGLPEEVSFDGGLTPDGMQLEGEAIRSPPPVPSTDIHLLEFEASGSGWKVVSLRNLTNRGGYDNQPSFLPDGGGMLFTSQRDGQTDIYRHDLDTGRNEQITDTPDTSEYSPTPLPEGGGFSTVRVEVDGSQRLWAFDLDGGGARLLLPDVEPVGYHAWIGPSMLALFVLGEPHTLQIVDGSDGSPRQVAESIGRGLQPVPDEPGTVAYVSKANGGSEDGAAGNSTETWNLLAIRAGKPARKIAATRPGSEDFVFLPDGRLVMAQDSSLFALEAKARWKRLLDLEPQGLREITRLAVHPEGTRIAIVADRPVPPPEPVREPWALSRAGKADRHAIP